MGLQYGIKEVLDLNIIDFKTKQPLVFIDYATTTTNDNKGTRLDLTGGRGNAKIMSFDHSRTSDFQIVVPLVDLNLLSILTGDDLKTGTDLGNIFKREVLTAVDNTGTIKVTLSQTPVGTPSVYKLKGLRDIGATVTGGTVSSKDITFSTGVVAGDELVVYYQYAAPATAQQFSVKTTKFPKAVEIYGEGLGRNQEDEQDYPVHIHVLKARPQMNFTFTMDGSKATDLTLTFDMYEVKDTNGDGHYIDYIFETV
jgi:hypothetical protein